MTSEGFWEIFEGDSAEMCAGKFLLVSMSGRAEGLAYAEPGFRTPTVIQNLKGLVVGFQIFERALK
jgi:hypothetical protein